MDSKNASSHIVVQFYPDNLKTRLFTDDREKANHIQGLCIKLEGLPQYRMNGFTFVHFHKGLGD